MIKLIICKNNYIKTFKLTSGRNRSSSAPRASKAGKTLGTTDPCPRERLLLSR